ncbi:hypothetical protein IQ06DRAFT_324807 [Phaeosphaeriaceae sp. SRC1lsM3a]|nr:hypothetical protein IQ06DRAFT_324807 [Stagonospora sp. SRC1lsM3a]
MSCATSMGFERRSSVPTSYGFVTTTTTTSIISTTCATVTVTPTASTFTGEVTTTTTITTTFVSTEAPTNVPTPRGFLPLFAFAPAAPTANSRIKRFELEARDAMGALSLLERRSADNYTNGFRAYRNGTTSNIFRRYPQEFDCTVQITIFKTEFVVEQGPPETVIAHVDAATSIRTSTVSSTTTVTSVMPGETIYAACQSNNVVNAVEGMTGETLIFDRVIYRPTEGFPLANEMIVPMDNPTDCCVACQKMVRPLFPFPHAMLSPLYTGDGETSASNPLSTASPTPSTCSTGSRGYYLGTVQGQTDFPMEYALWMSNGPCGRLSVWPVPVNSSLDTSLSGPPVPVKRGVKLLA